MSFNFIYFRREIEVAPILLRLTERRGSMKKKMKTENAASIFDFLCRC